MKVRDIMERPVVTVAPTDTVLQLCRLMSDHDVRAVIVISDHSPVGLVTEHQVIEHCIAEGRNPSECTVATTIGHGKQSQLVTTVSADTDTIAAALILAKQRTAWLVVMEADRPIGILSVANLAKEARFYLDGLLDAMSGRSEPPRLAYRYTYRESWEANAPTGAPFD